MNFYQRAFRYIQRKKSKSILLFMCLLIISTMILSASMMLQTAQATSRSMWEKTGTKLVLKNLRGENKIAGNVIAEISELPTVTKINRIASNIAYPGDFSPVIVNDGTEPINFAVTLHAYDNTEIDGQFAQEKYRLIKGVPITENQDGILVNSILAEVNGMSIGDQITFTTDDGNIASGKIIGIFFSGMERRQDDSTAAAYRIENQIFIDHGLFETLYGEVGYSSVSVYTTEPERLNDLNQQIELLIDSDISIATSDVLYQQMQAPLKQVIRITTLMLALIVITAIIVISLLLCMWARTRTKEFAVLISLGVSKSNLLLQSITESLTLFAFSVVGAAAISSLFTKQIMSSLFETNDLVSMVNTHLEAKHLLMLLILGGVIVLAAVGISIFPTLRANPRETLSRMEG